MLLIICLLYFAITNDRMILYFEIIFLLSYTNYLIIYINNKSKNIFIDIRIYLLISYSIYALYTPIVYLIYNKTGYINLNNGLNTYNYNVLIKSLFICILFFIAFSLPFIFYNKIINKNSYMKEWDNKINTSYKKNSFEFNFWLILFLISFIWYIYPYTKMGIKEALNYGRWERYVIFGEIRNEMGFKSKIISLFFSQYLMILSTFMMFREVCNKRCKSKQKYVFVILIIFEALFLLFIDSRRRELIYIIIMCFSYFMYYSYNKIKKSDIRKYLIYLIIIAIFFTAYQYYRDYFSLANKEGISYALEVKRNASLNYDKEQKLYANEFGMVYENILSSVEFTPEFYFGKTYLESILAPIPIINKIFYYDGDKTTLLSRWQSQIYPDIFLNGGGLGFFPAAEAYLNLGYAGCIIFGLILGIFFNYIYLKMYNTKNILYYCILLPQGWNFSRISFLGVTEEIFWYMFYVIFYNAILKIMKNNRKNYINRNEVNSLKTINY